MRSFVPRTGGRRSWCRSHRRDGFFHPVWRDCVAQRSGWRLRNYSQAYTYDDAANLSGLVSRRLSGGPGVGYVADYAATYSYPPDSNAGDGLGAHAVKGVSAGPAAGTYAYTNGGQLSLWSDAATGATVSSATAYTPFGRPETVTQKALPAGTVTSQSQFGYWPDGSRAVTVSTSAQPKTVTVDAGATTYTTQINGSGVLAPTAASRAYVGPSGLVATRSGATGWVWLLPDQQGSVRASARSSSGAVTKTTFLPFGQPTTAGAADTVAGAGFLGKVHTAPGFASSQVTGSNPAGGSHAATGQAPGDSVALDHRDYATSLARFTTPDPLYDLAEPQSINPYSYSVNNPAGRADPSGLMNASCDDVCGSDLESAAFLDSDNHFIYDNAFAAAGRFDGSGITDTQLYAVGTSTMGAAAATVAGLVKDGAVGVAKTAGYVAAHPVLQPRLQRRRLP
jgi:RHS repeat-associated protein